MENDKQSNKYAMSRSRIGSMSFEEIGKYIGATYNPDVDVMKHQSGSSQNPQAGN